MGQRVNRVKKKQKQKNKTTSTSTHSLFGMRRALGVSPIFNGGAPHARTSHQAGAAPKASPAQERGTLLPERQIHVEGDVGEEVAATKAAGIGVVLESHEVRVLPRQCLADRVHVGPLRWQDQRRNVVGRQREPQYCGTTGDRKSCYDDNGGRPTEIGGATQLLPPTPSPARFAHHANHNNIITAQQSPPRLTALNKGADGLEVDPGDKGLAKVCCAPPGQELLLR